MNLLNYIATGDVVAQTLHAILWTVTLAAGSDAATVVVRSGGASGTIHLKLAAVTGDTVTWCCPSNMNGVPIGDGIHITVTGTGPSVTVGFSAAG